MDCSALEAAVGSAAERKRIIEMKDEKRITGQIGEELAMHLLEEKGYAILQRNYRCRSGEIDIVAMHRKKRILCFVEVKTRTDAAFGEPAEAVTRAKQHKIRQTAMQYLNEYQGGYLGVEFQIVEIVVRHLDGLEF